MYRPAHHLPKASLNTSKMALQPQQKYLSVVPHRPLNVREQRTCCKPYYILKEHGGLWLGPVFVT